MPQNSHPPAIYALGNFDGVHRGHQALIAAARQLADAQRLPLVALTFAPHPRRYFAPTLPPFLLTDDAHKAGLLRAAGADSVTAIPFTAALAAMTAPDFAQRILLREHNARAIVAGEDFRFGYQRAGDMQRLAEWMQPSGVAVHAVTPVRDGQGQRYATSTARALLQTAQVRAAAAILGRPWSVCGAVIHGDARGRKIGFPTANIALGDYLRPIYGVYAVRGRRLGGADWVSGVANIGLRPTVDGAGEALEVHFFDFNAEIYNQVWEIAFIDFIRPEQRFPAIEHLVAAIRQDAAAARRILAA